MNITLEKLYDAYLYSLSKYNRQYVFLNKVYERPLTVTTSIGLLDKKICPEIDSRYISSDDDLYWKIIGAINYDKTISNLIKKYPNIIRFDPDSECRFLFTDDWAYDLNELELFVTNVIPKAFIDCIETNSEQATIGYISAINNNGARISKRVIKQINNNEILCNYNDDLPNEEIIKFLSSKESGLIVLRGLPGTGKTSYIRSLINLIRDKSFVTMDINDFSSLVSNKQCLSDIEDKILILEDCEDLLKDRSRSSFAYYLSTLLNITDGLFGDFLNIKIICTFNADLNNVDKALLRKGRIKIMYEFKALSKDKADILRAKLGKQPGASNILCDIYNEDSSGVKDQVKTTKIGF